MLRGMLSTRTFRRFTVAALAATVLVLTFAISASAASVAYLDGKEVWVAKTDGSQRIRLSSGEGDWTAVSQADDGHIVGVQLEAGKIAQLSRFTVWNPNGQRIRFGALSATSNGSFAYPLSLDLTNGGGLIVHGFSQYIYGFPVGQLNEGFFLKASADASIQEPVRVMGARYPTLVGTRVVGRISDTQVGLQDPGSTGSDVFTPWISLNDPGGKVRRTDVSANGQFTAIEVEFDGNPTPRKIYMGKWAGLGGAYVDDCLLQVDASAIEPSISQDGSEFAWQDGGGVKVAGIPNFNGAAACQLTRAPITISPTGSYPSIGQFNLAVAQQPVITPPTSLKLSKLLSRSGVSISVQSAVGGKATIKLTVTPKSVGKKGKKPIVIASAKTTLLPNVAKSIKLKLNKAGKKLKKKLKRKKAKLSITVGGQTTVVNVKIK